MYPQGSTTPWGSIGIYLGAGIGFLVFVSIVIAIVKLRKISRGDDQIPTSNKRIEKVIEAGKRFSLFY